MTNDTLLETARRNRNGFLSAIAGITLFTGLFLNSIKGELIDFADYILSPQISSTQEFNPINSDFRNYEWAYGNSKTSPGDFSGDSDRVLLARLLFGEGRSMSDEELYRIGHTALNRAERRGTDLTTEALRPWQYSCFNEWDPNLEKLSNPTEYEPFEWARCLGLAEDILEGNAESYDLGQTHYHMKQNSIGEWLNPGWCRNMEEIINSNGLEHQFYRGN